MRRSIAIAVLAGALAGCASPVRPPTAAEMQTTTTTNRVVDRNYEVGTERTAFVGEAVVRVKDYHETTQTVGAAIATTAPVELYMIPFGPRAAFPAQTSLVYVGKVSYGGESFDAYSWPHNAFAAYPVLFRSDGTATGQLYNQSNGRPFDPVGSFIRVTPQLPGFAKAPIANTQTAAGYTNFEIVYSGATRETISLLYREYTPSDLARPAFSQQLTYERSSKTIRFRDIVIRIAEVTGDQLRYTVESDGIAP